MSEYWFPYFGPLVVKTEISESFRKKLLLEGKHSKIERLLHTDQLVGMIKEEFLIENPESWFIPEFSPLLSLYQNIAEQDWNETTTELQKPYEISNMELWINYQKCKEFNPRHNHSGDLSFVIYLKIPKELKEENKQTKAKHNNNGTGTIEFTYGEKLLFNKTGFSHLPKEGDVYIFPSWLNHSVLPFFSDVERITAAGNIFLKRNVKDFVDILTWEHR